MVRQADPCNGLRPPPHEDADGRACTGQRHERRPVAARREDLLRRRRRRVASLRAPASSASSNSRTAGGARLVLDRHLRSARRPTGLASSRSSTGASSATPDRFVSCSRHLSGAYEPRMRTAQRLGQRLGQAVSTGGTRLASSRHVSPSRAAPRRRGARRAARRVRVRRDLVEQPARCRERGCVTGGVRDDDDRAEPASAGAPRRDALYAKRRWPGSPGPRPRGRRAPRR